MSYTPPTYVDTKAQAILALASVVADEDKTNLGDGSVNRALDVLADVLADSDVQVPQTNAGAILALAQYASGMIKPEGTITITENGEGIDVAQYATADVSVSGGVDVGNLVAVWAQPDAPVVNEELGGYASNIINTVSLTPYSSPTIVASNDTATITMAASGTFVQTSDGAPFEEEHPACYDAVIDDNYVFTSVAALENVNITATPISINDGQYYTYEIEVPALELGHSLIVVATTVQ